RIRRRECRLARRPGAAARRCQPARAPRCRHNRPENGLRGDVEPARVSRDPAGRRTCRKPPTGARAPADGTRIPAEMIMTPHVPSRRELLLGSGALFAWAYFPKLALAEGRDPRLLVIVLRGALDGLAAVAPVGDPDWGRLRGNQALRLEGAMPALRLDQLFAL